MIKHFSFSVMSDTVADPGFAKDGADNGEHAERKPITGSWGAVGSRGKASDKARAVKLPPLPP